MADVPLIIQIQQAAINSNDSVSDALRKAKLACAKLGLADFGEWVNLEVNGYENKTRNDIPEYRLLVGNPQSLNPYRGWQNIMFQSQEMFDTLSRVPVASPISIIESQLRNADSDDSFEFQYTVEQEMFIRKAIGFDFQLRIKIDPSAMMGITNSVRNILTDWTIELEKNGVIGDGLVFSSDDKKSSAVATEGVINNFHMHNVGAFVQSAQQSVVQGGVDSTFDLGKVGDLIGQIEAQRAQLPAAAWSEIEREVQTIKAELVGSKNRGRIRAALGAISGVCVKIGTSVAASGIVHLIGAMLS